MVRVSDEHRHDWSVGWDGYVCQCGSERSFSDQTLTTVVVESDTEERVVNAVLAALREEPS